MNKFVWICVVLAIEGVSNCFGQVRGNLDSAQVSYDTDRVSRYGIGALSFVRYSPVRPNFAFEQDSWWMFGGGVSAVRYRSDRQFLSASVAYAVVQFDQLNVPDIRFIINPTTGQFEQQELGTRDETWTYGYITVPIDFHYLLFDNQTTNVYLSGGVVLDWVRRLKREITATYDGRFNDFSGANIDDLSATVRAGTGIYQPFASNWTLLFGLTYGYTFFSGYEEDIQVRSSNLTPSLALRLYYRIP